MPRSTATRNARRMRSSSLVPEASHTALLGAGMVLVSVIGLAAVGLHVSRIRRAARLQRRALVALGVTSLLLFPAAAVYVAVEVASAQRWRSDRADAVFRGRPGRLPDRLRGTSQSDLAAGDQLQDLLSCPYPAAIPRGMARRTGRGGGRPGPSSWLLGRGAARYVEPDGRGAFKDCRRARPSSGSRSSRDDHPVAPWQSDLGPGHGAGTD